MICIRSKYSRFSLLPALLILLMSLSGCAAVAVTKAAATATKTAVKATGAAAGLAAKGVKAAVRPKEGEKDPADDAKTGQDG